MPYDPITLLSTLSTIVLPPDTQDSLSVSWLDSYRMGFPPMKHYTLCWAHTDRLSRYGSTPCGYIIRKCRTLQDSFRLFSFSTCYPAKTEVSYDTKKGGVGLEKDSALYQLMDTRMNGVMNGIVSSDGEYQTILRKSDIYSGELDRMDLSKEIRLLIDRYVSEQNALGSRFGMLAYLLGFSDCKAMFLGKCLPTEAKEMTAEL